MTGGQGVWRGVLARSIQGDNLLPFPPSPCPLPPSSPCPHSPLPAPHSLFSPPSSHPISTHFRGLSLYLIALTIKLWKISPTHAWSARTIGNRRGRRISAPISSNRAPILPTVSLTTSSRSTSCMVRSARPTREK